jgi:8-oxo-dGTP pyrophosphatase MutT (NUDIX family)
MTLEELQTALARDVPYIKGLEPLRRGRHAAVLALISPESEILLTLRSKELRNHSGQIAFPGGLVEASESSLEAALRESGEEVGLDPSQITVAGTLPPLWTYVSDFWVEPLVALGRVPFSAMDLSPHSPEIAAVFAVRLKDLSQTHVMMDFKGYPNHTFQTPHGELWGVTGAMVFNLLSRLQLLV